MSPVRTNAHLEEIAARFQGIRPNGKGIKALCPCHPDKEPSLHLSIGDKGGVVITCFVGCKTADILDAVGLTFRDLMPREAWPGHNGRNAEAPALTPYSYVDETGTLLYQNVRKQFRNSKEFFVRRPQKGGGWINSLGTVRRVLFDLPGVIEAKANRSMILFVEGEKDQSRAKGLGHAATTIAGGAKAWRREYADQLAGAQIAILPDQDRAGYELALAAFADLQDTADNVIILQIMGMAEKSDFSDFADRVGNEAAAVLLISNEHDVPPGDEPYIREISPETLAQLAGKSEANDPGEADPEEAEAQSQDGAFDWSPMSEVTEEDIEWLWRGWIARGKLHMLIGVQGDGKSTVVNSVTAALSQGRKLPDGQVPDRPFRVAYLVSEDGIADTVVPRIRIEGGNLANHIVIRDFVRNGVGEFPSLVDHLPYIEAFIVEHNIDLLAIDAVTDYLGSIKQNNNDEVRSVLRPVRDVAERTDCAVVGVGHLGKPGQGSRRAVERMLGAGAFTQVPRLILGVTADDEDEERRFFGPIKGNICRLPATLAWHRDEDRPVSWDGEAESSLKAKFGGQKPRSKVEVARDFLLAYLENGPQPANDVASAAKEKGIGRGSLHTAKSDVAVVSFKEETADGRWMWSLSHA
jgi:putative DNA primase/helicase